MKNTTKWSVTSNDGDVVTLRRETDNTYEESTIQRPDNTDKKAWLDQWPVGLEIGNDAYHDRVRFESVRRKDVGVLSKSEQAVADRWNRKDAPRKQVADGMESLRAFLENFDKTSLLGYARAIYLKHSTRDGIGAEFAAIKDHDSLCAFLDKHDRSVPDAPLDIVALERVEREGLDFSKWKDKGQA